MSTVAQVVHGIFSRVPAEEYFGLPGTSITRLKELRRSPQHYQHGLVAPKQSAPLALGRAAHTAVLEPERFVSEYAVWARRSESGNLCPRNGQHWDKFQAQYPGRSIITEDEAIDALGIQHAIRECPAAMRYLESGEPEVVMRWQMAGRECRGRIDWLTPPMPGSRVVHEFDDEGDDRVRIEELPPMRTIVGLKTSVDCRHFKFGAQAAKFGYHLQWAFYEDGYKVLKGEQVRLVEIVVESAPPYAVAVYEITEDIREQGRVEYEELLKLLDECELTDQWPGPQPIEEPLTLPTWAYPQADDISELGLEA